jgi:TonB family protein
VGKIKSCRLFPFFVVALLAASSLSAEQARDGTQPQNQDRTGKQAAEADQVTNGSYPEEALKKNVEGKVILRIGVDAQGKVSDAKALSRPSELFQAALTAYGSARSRVTESRVQNQPENRKENSFESGFLLS